MIPKYKFTKRQERHYKFLKEFFKTAPEKSQIGLLAIMSRRRKVSLLLWARYDRRKNIETIQNLIDVIYAIEKIDKK